MSTFCCHLLSCKSSLLWMDVNKKSCMSWWLGIFKFVIPWMLFLTNTAFLQFWFFFIRFIHSKFVMFFPSPYFTPKLLRFFYPCLLICFGIFSTNLLVEFSFVILEFSVLFILFDPVQIPLESSFFRQYLLIYFLQLYSQTCLQLCFWRLFFPLGSWVPLFKQFLSMSDFFICSFSLTSYPVLYFYSNSYLATDFAPA